MSDIQSIENKLSELIPSSVSQQGLDQMEITIDRLSQEAVANDFSDDVCDGRNDGASLSWYRLSQWRIAAVFAILAVSSVAIATKIGFLEVHLRPLSAVPAKVAPVKQPKAPQITKAVVSSIKMGRDSLEQNKDSKGANKIELTAHGMVVEKLDEAHYAELPELRRGSGLLLKELDQAGAAESAGMEPLDIISKIDDQWVVNGQQLNTLLSMPHNDGQVSVTYYRDGKKKDTVMFVESVIANVYGAYDRDLSASIGDGKSTATLSFREGKPWLRVESAKGVETYNGYISKDEDIAKVPTVWRDSINILKDSIKKSSENRQRYRQRYIPKAKNGFADSFKQ